MRRILAFCTLFALSTALAAADTLPPQLAGAFATMASAKTYHMSLNAHGQQVDMDIVNPGRQHLTISGRHQIEMIRIDSDTYMKMNGSWQKFSMPGMDSMIAEYGKYREIGASHAADAKIVDLGMTAVGGESLHEYEVSTATTDPADIYVGTDGTIHQIVVPKAKSGPVTMVFSAYNTPITIVAPI
jgi:hypothetical protein